MSDHDLENSLPRRFSEQFLKTDHSQEYILSLSRRAVDWQNWRQRFSSAQDFEQQQGLMEVLEATTKDFMAIAGYHGLIRLVPFRGAGEYEAYAREDSDGAIVYIDTVWQMENWHGVEKLRALVFHELTHAHRIVKHFLTSCTTIGAFVTEEGLASWSAEELLGCSTQKTLTLDSEIGVSLAVCGAWDSLPTYLNLSDHVTTATTSWLQSERFYRYSLSLFRSCATKANLCLHQALDTPSKDLADLVLQSTRSWLNEH